MVDGQKISLDLVGPEDLCKLVKGRSKGSSDLVPATIVKACV
jgi:hypothetical protein